MAAFIIFLKGYLRICFSGLSAQRFLNLCAGKQIRLWNISRAGEKFSAFLLLRDFYRLRPVTRKTGVRVVIQQRIGLPFLMPVIRRRWMFLLGFLLALIFWIGSSLFVWEIRITGNESVTEDQLFSFLAGKEIRLGKALKDLNLSELEKELRKTFPQITWTCVKVTGTQLSIDIKENDVVFYEPETEKTGCSLVSEYAGTVASIVVREGVPMVKAGDVVEAGQVLVEGCVPVYAEDGTVKDRIRSNADADVWLERDYRYQEKLPLYYEMKQFTGRVKKDYYLKWNGNNYFGFHDLAKHFFRETAIVRTESPSACKLLQIPLSFGEILHQECQIVLCRHSQEEAENILLEKNLKFLSTLEEKGVQIIEKNVKIGFEGSFALLEGWCLIREKVQCFRGTEGEFDNSGQ